SNGRPCREPRRYNHKRQTLPRGAKGPNLLLTVMICSDAPLKSDRLILESGPNSKKKPISLSPPPIPAPRESDAAHPPRSSTASGTPKKYGQSAERWG